MTKTPLFVHVPKTGGTSVSSVLGDSNYFGHCTPAKIQTIIGPANWNACFKFAFVRNPWDHAVSFYESHKRRFKSTIVSSSFCGWVFDGMKIGWENDWITNDQINDPILMEQFITDDMFVGRFENLQPDFDYIYKQIGRERTELPCVNVSQRHKDYRTYYQNDRTIKLVAERNQWIIDNYGYTF